jgi:hypothetical protein
MLRFIFTLAIFTIVFTPVISQNAQIAKNYEWTEYYNNDGIRIEYKFSECIHESEGYFREFVLIRIINTTDSHAIVDWDYVMFYEHRCVNCDMNSTEHHRTIELAPNSSTEGSCTYGEPKTLKIFSKFLNYEMPDAILSNFQLENITIEFK